MYEFTLLQVSMLVLFSFTSGVVSALFLVNTEEKLRMLREEKEWIEARKNLPTPEATDESQLRLPL